MSPSAVGKGGDHLPALHGKNRRPARIDPLLQQPRGRWPAPRIRGRGTAPRIVANSCFRWRGSAGRIPPIDKSGRAGLNPTTSVDQNRPSGASVYQPWAEAITTMNYQIDVSPAVPAAP